MTYNNISAKKITLGTNVVIDETAVIRGLNGPAEEIFIGDNTYIGASVQIICDDFSVGDYSKIHQHTVIHGYQPCKIGHNAWIGPFCMFDSVGGLIINDNFACGAQSQLWTHMIYSDTLEGSNFHLTKKLSIGNDVYLGGNCKLMGMKAENKSAALLGAVVIKDMKYNRTYAGSPAVDITSKIGAPFRDVSTEEKYQKLKELLEESGVSQKNIKIVHTVDEFKDDGVSYFAVKTRQYLKHRSEEEIKFIRFLLPAKAKFTPHNPFI